MYKFVGPRQTSPLADGCRLISHRYPCLYVTFLYLSGFNHRCNVAVCRDVVGTMFLFGFQVVAQCCENAHGPYLGLVKAMAKPCGLSSPWLPPAAPTARGSEHGPWPPPVPPLPTWNSSYTFVCKYLFKKPRGRPMSECWLWLFCSSF